MITFTFSEIRLSFMRTDVSKIKTGSDLVVLLVFSCVILSPVLFLLSNYYEDVMQVVFKNDPHQYLERAWENTSYKMLFKGFKIVLLLVPLWLAAVWYDHFTDKKRKTTRFLSDAISGTLYRSLQDNRAFIGSLDHRVKVIFALTLAVFFIAECFLLQTTPTSYDELFSYSLFSSKGAWACLSYYPVPNNHVLYNMVAGLFLDLPFDAEVAVRIPALLASLLTVYYFFKLSYKTFGGKTASAITLLVLCLYPIQLFSISARGYAFTNLCCVLLLYAIVQLAQAPASGRYRWLFILSGAAGMAAVPSFLYALFPLYLMYGIYLLVSKQRRSLRLWIRDCVICGILIAMSYSFIYLLNDHENLTNPNGGATTFSLSDPNLFGIITGHLKQVSDYLFLHAYTLFIVYALMIVSLGYSLLLKKQKPSLLVVLSFLMVLSPVIILPLHRVLPFERNWLYLVFPCAICLGFLIRVFSELLQGLVSPLQKYDVKRKLAFVLLALLATSYTLFDKAHRYNSKIDYEIAVIREEYVDSQANNIQHISMTNTGMEYYPTEFIKFLCQKEYPKRPVILTQLDSIRDQDILVIENSEEQRFREQLSGYRVLRYFDEHFTVYCRKTLK